MPGLIVPESGGGVSESQFIVLSSGEFFDWRCQDLTDSGPSGFDLNNVSGFLHKEVVSPFGLGSAIMLDGAATLKLQDPLHEPSFRDFALLESSVSYFAGVWLSDLTAGAILYIGGDANSDGADTNQLLSILHKTSHDLEIGGEYGPGTNSLFTAPGVPLYSLFAIAVSKEPGATSGKVIYKLHSRNGIIHEEPEIQNTDTCPSAVLRLGERFGIAAKWKGIYQQVILQNEKPSDGEIQESLSAYNL